MGGVMTDPKRGAMVVSTSDAPFAFEASDSDGAFIDVERKDSKSPSRAADVGSASSAVRDAARPLGSP